MPSLNRTSLSPGPEPKYPFLAPGFVMSSVVTLRLCMPAPLGFWVRVSEGVDVAVVVGVSVGVNVGVADGVGVGVSVGEDEGVSYTCADVFVPLAVTRLNRMYFRVLSPERMLTPMGCWAALSATMPMPPMPACR